MWGNARSIVTHSSSPSQILGSLQGELIPCIPGLNEKLLIFREPPNSFMTETVII